jgi:hypothetical protein
VLSTHFNGGWEGGVQHGRLQGDLPRGWALMRLCGTCILSG